MIRGQWIDVNSSKKVLAELAIEGWQLKYASKGQQNDSEVVMVAVAQNGRARQYASVSLQIELFLKNVSAEDEETKGDDERHLHSKQGAQFTMFSGRPSSTPCHSNKEQAPKETMPSPRK